MSISIILLLVAAGVLILPNLGGDEDEDENTDNRTEIMGGPGNDGVTGTSGNDLIRTFLGNDTIDGGRGNDEILAGEGEDFVEGGAKNDFIRGGAGDDELYGNEGNDRIFADRGDDFVDGGRGSDFIRGGQGADTILGGVNSVLDENRLPISRSEAVDSINGEAGDDLIIAWGDGSTILGGVVDGDEFDDEGSNNDIMVAASGDVVMSGQTGDNTVVALANLQDNTDLQEGTITRASVTDFDLDRDTLVLTVDHTSSAEMPADFEPKFIVNYSIEDSDTQGRGTLVTITWDNPYGLEGQTTSESAQAFLGGYPRDFDILGDADAQAEAGLAGLRLEIYLTEDASYADPLGTLTDLELLPPKAILPTAVT